MSGLLAAIALTISGSLDLQPVLDRLISEQDVPGMSAVVTHRGDVVYLGASGVANIESGKRMAADTVLYAGSLSKIYTAVLVLKLVDDGKLSLSDRVGDIAGNDSPTILISHLLTHSSGLVREGNFGYWFSADFPDRDALKRFLAQTSLESTPGERVRYSNIGYAALGLTIEDRTGLTYREALKKYVLQPLGMQDSGSAGPIIGLAAGYTPKGRIIPSEERPFAGVGRQVGERHRRDYYDARAMSPAFGIFTTAEDLGRLARFLLGYGGDLLPDELRTTLLSPQNGSRTYGLGAGTYRDRQIARHSGWFAAHRSHILVDPESGLAVAVLANSDNANPGAAARALLGAALDSGADGDSVN